MKPQDPTRRPRISSPLRPQPPSDADGRGRATSTGNQAAGRPRNRLRVATEDPTLLRRQSHNNARLEALAQEAKHGQLRVTRALSSTQVFHTLKDRLAEKGELLAFGASGKTLRSLPASALAHGPALLPGKHTKTKGHLHSFQWMARDVMFATQLLGDQVERMAQQLQSRSAGASLLTTFQWLKDHDSAFGRALLRESSRIPKLLVAAEQTHLALVFVPKIEGALVVRPRTPSLRRPGLSPSHSTPDVPTLGSLFPTQELGASFV